MHYVEVISPGVVARVIDENNYLLSYFLKSVLPNVHAIINSL